MTLHHWGGKKERQTSRTHPPTHTSLSERQNSFMWYNKPVLVVYKATSDYSWLTNRFSVVSTDSGMNNTTLPQESDTALDSPGFMAYSILLTVIALAVGVVMGNNSCSTCNCTVHCTTTLALPHQPSAGWTDHGIGRFLHISHIRCPCSGGLRTAQTPTVPMQSLSADGQHSSGGMARAWQLFSVLAIVQNCPPKQRSKLSATWVNISPKSISTRMDLAIFHIHIHKTLHNIQ